MGDVGLLFLLLVGFALMVGLRRIAHELAMLLLLVVAVTMATPHVLRWAQERWTHTAAMVTSWQSSLPSSSSARASTTTPTTPSQPAAPEQSEVSWLVVVLLLGYVVGLALALRFWLSSRRTQAAQERAFERERTRERERVLPSVEPLQQDGF